VRGSDRHCHAVKARLPVSQLGLGAARRGVASSQYPRMVLAAPRRPLLDDRFAELQPCELDAGMARAGHVK
jgi:hypothetical protein